MLKIAFFSPLSPQHSGIADYSEELLPYLAKQAEIDLFVDGFAPTNKQITSRFRVFDYRRNPEVLNRLKEYDATIYHMGNDHRYHTGIYRTALKHPGVVVIHDFALQHFFCGMTETEADGVDIYLDELEASSGYDERRVAEEFFASGQMPPQAGSPLKYPLNSRLAQHSEGLIVHSDWSRTRLQKIAPFVPVRRVPFAISPHEEYYGSYIKKTESNSRHPDKPIQIASFGLITPGKGLERALRVLAKFKNRFNFQYTLVGETNPHFDIRAIIDELNLRNRVKITEFVSMQEFISHIADTDIAINLREQTVGETSSSLCRIMQAGVTAIVSDDGWFSELPENSAVKIDMHDCTDALLEAYLGRLMKDRNLRRQIGANAQRYMTENHRIEDSAAHYIKFVDEIINSRARRRFIQRVSSDVAQLGIDDKITESFLPTLAREIAKLTAKNPPDKKMINS